MISSQILIDFINVEKAIQAHDVLCNHRTLSFVAPTCLKTVIINTFEPLSNSVSVSDINFKESLYVIQ